MAFIVRPAPAVSVNFGDVRQTWEGFGASDPFLDTTSLSTAQADLFFGTGAGQIGLSCLFIGIDWPGTNMGNWATAAQAVARGATLIAAPWTAAASEKDNGDINNGGHLLVSAYDAWASRMAAFDGLAVTNTGAHLSVVSVQTEPDFTNPTSVSMRFTPPELTAFIKVLGPKLAALAVPPRLMMPEVADWNNLQSFVTDTMADGTAAPMVALIGVHQYGGTLGPPTGIGTRTLWMTEMSYFSTFDATMTNALVMAADIHAAIVTGNVTAWIWWWIIRTLRADNEGLTDTSQQTKRLWALGNFSRFIRPGYVRCGTTGTISGVSLTGWQNPTTKDFVLVLINPTASAVDNLAIGVPSIGRRVSTVTPYITDATRDLAPQAAVPVNGGLFTLSLAPSSVTSYVGVAA